MDAATPEALRADIDEFMATHSHPEPCAFCGGRFVPESTGVISAYATMERLLAYQENRDPQYTPYHLTDTLREQRIAHGYPYAGDGTVLGVPFCAGRGQ